MDVPMEIAIGTQRKVSATPYLYARHHSPAWKLSATLIFLKLTACSSHLKAVGIGIQSALAREKSIPMKSHAAAFLTVIYK